MTVLKRADDKQPTIDALNALLARPDVDPPTRKHIEEEIWTTRAGILGERDAAYEIDFEYANRQSHVVIHDLRIEFAGRVAQIDHLLIGRVMDIWVCETKSFKEGVKINEYGEWYRYGGGRAHGMASPVEQNRRHVAVLKDVFDKGAVRLPRRVVTLKPSLLPVILVSNNARIDRPAARKAAKVEGLDTVIKVEQLARAMDRRFDEHNAVRFLAKIVSVQTIQDIGRQLIAMHKPATVDWAARFGLNAVPGVPGKPTAAESTTATPSQPVCESCGKPLSTRVVEYLDANVGTFDGRRLCFDCQNEHRRTRRKLQRAPNS